MLHSIRVVTAIAVACSLMHLASCGSKQPATDTLPLLAGLDDRLASSTADVTASGSETLARSAGAVEQGTNLRLESEEDGLEWAIYRLDPPGVMIPQNATVTLSTDSTNEAWVAVGDYASLRWEFSGPYSGPADISDLDSNNVSPNGYVYIAVVVSGAHTGVVESVSLTSQGNLPPVASFTASPQTAAPGTEVSLDASASSDPDGYIVSHEWDLDGDGVFELNNGSDSEASTTMPDQMGTVTVGLRVTDDGGLSDTFTLDLKSGWTVVVVETSPLSDETYLSSLAVINGKPAIAYYDANYYALKYAHSNTVDGSSGWTTLTVDPEGNGAPWLWMSLAEISGKPAIAYNANGGIKYAYSSQPDGSSDWTTLTVEPAGGSYPSLAEVDGKPAISFISAGGLSYAYSSAADGSSGWSTLSVENLSWPGGRYTSLAVVDGRPAIGYSDLNAGSSALKYAFSSTANGASGWTSLTIDSGQDTGFVPSLKVVDGTPAMAYLGFLQADGYYVKYARSSIADGSSGWTSKGITLGTWSSLAVIDGRPAIACTDNTGAEGTGADIKFSLSDWSNGDGGWNSSFVDTGEFFCPSLANVNGKPAISYVGAGELRYAVLLP